MPMIYVKAKEGCRAYFEGRVIPQDKFIPVTDTPYIRRLVNHWGDLDLQGGEQKKPAAPQKHVPSPTASAPQKADTDNTRPPSRQAATPTQAAPNIPAPGTGAPKPHN